MSQKLLNLSRTESVEDDVGEIVYMAPTVQRVVLMLDAIAQENKIRIETDLTQDSPILILEDDLYQIAFNLVENGIKYNTPGGVLKIRLLQEDDMGVLQVEDSGVGIPSEALEHIFERFYRVDKARSRKSGGSGLGLAIVRSMVQRNGGEISVESNMGIGSTFTVRFPAFDLDKVNE
jgi:signal transduction histidine kinase